MALYHSGDTIPYEGLAERVKAHQVDLALLPINGRGKGVPGNFTLAEAIQLCHRADIPYLIPHHFGMFAFNTVDPEVIKALRSKITSPACLIPTLTMVGDSDIAFNPSMRRFDLSAAPHTSLRLSEEDTRDA